ncbi:hypothetical protein N7488_011381 [Penicillium malachiteum]|nr:hypothetical protein N7488_011381 [Penicillium malachiteum]
MPRVKQHSAWQWYAGFKNKNDLDLPDIETEMLGTYRIYCDELFCRVPGCNKVTKETNLNNLRKHYARMHPDIAITAPTGGRPTLEEEKESIDFYKRIREAYDSRPVIKPELPMKPDGTVHLTKARKIVREAGGQVPCEPCKDAGDRIGCVRLENKARCENFEYFEMDVSDPEGLDQELDEMETDSTEDSDDEVVA